MQGDRSRRSAKDVIHDMAQELLARHECADTRTKLLLIETIASRMSWTDLFNKIRYRTKPVQTWQPYKD